jgi:hypothetical protein
MGSTLRLTARLEKRGPAGASLLSDEQVTTLGAGAKVFPVLVTIAGTTLRLRLARMGGENLIGLSRAARAQAGVEVGDEVDVAIAADTAPRTIEVPEDLAAALAADPAARAAFDALAPSPRKEYVRRVTEAKRAQTRAQRVATTIERVREHRPR